MRSSEKHAEVKTLKLLKLQAQWEQICESEKKSLARNKKLLKDFEDLEAIATDIASRTEKLRILKDRYRNLIVKSNAAFETEKYPHGHPRSSTPLALSSNVSPSEALKLRNSKAFKPFPAESKSGFREPSVRRKIPSSRSAPGSFCSSIGKPSSVKNLESNQSKNISASQSDPYSSLVSRLHRLDAGGKAQVKSNITSLFKHEVSQNISGYLSNVSRNHLIGAQKPNTENIYIHPTKSMLNINKAQETQCLSDLDQHPNDSAFSHNFTNANHNLNEDESSQFLHNKTPFHSTLENAPALENYMHEPILGMESKLLELLLNNESLYHQIKDSQQQKNQFLGSKTSDYRNKHSSSENDTIFARYRRNSLTFAKPTYKENAEVRLNLNTQRKLSLPVNHSSLIKDEQSDPYHLSLINSNINLSSILSNTSDSQHSMAAEKEGSVTKVDPYHILFENASNNLIPNSTGSSLASQTESKKIDAVAVETRHTINDIDVVLDHISHSTSNSPNKDTNSLHQKDVSFVIRNESFSPKRNSGTLYKHPSHNVILETRQDFENVQAVNLMNAVEKNQNTNQPLPSSTVTKEIHDKKKEISSNQNLNLSVQHYQSSDLFNSNLVVPEVHEKNKRSSFTHQNVHHEGINDEKAVSFQTVPSGIVTEQEKIRTNNTADSAVNVEAQDYSPPQKENFENEISTSAADYEKEKPFIDKKSEKEQINNQSKINDNKIYLEKATKLSSDSSLSENEIDHSSKKLIFKDTNDNMQEVLTTSNEIETEKPLNKVGDNLHNEAGISASRRITNTVDNFENSSDDEDSFFDQKILTAQNAYKMLLQASSTNQNVNDDSSGDDIENELASFISDNKGSSELRIPVSGPKEVELQVQILNDKPPLSQTKETTEVEAFGNSESPNIVKAVTTTPAKIKDKIKKSTILSFGLDSDSDVSLPGIEGGKGESDKDDFSFYD